MAAEAKLVALVGGTLIDGTGALPVRDAVVIVRGNRIEAAGQVSVPPGAAVRRVDGKTILPGQIDAHVHVGTSGGGLADPREFSTATLAANLKTYLIHGVTAIMDMGAQPRLDAMKADIESGAMPGPRLFGVKYGLTAPDSHPMGLLRELRAVDKLGSHFREVDTVEEARSWVKKIAAEKPDGLKIYHSRSEFPGTNCLDCNREKQKPEVLKALIEEGHAHGLRVFAHVAWPSEAREVAEAGVDCLAHPITHAETGAQRVFELMAEKGVWMHSTIVRVENYFALRVEPFLREKLRGKVADAILDSLAMENSVARARHEGDGISADARRIFDVTMANIRRARKAGVAIVLGTDSGGVAGLHGVGVPRELELLNEAGLTAMEAIVAGTKTAAGAIGQGDRLGTVEPGKLADMIVIDGDPLRDISNVRKLALVIKDGAVFDPAEISVH
jgi:imidazolonepropionase-like amidohydrolase